MDLLMDTFLQPSALVQCFWICIIINHCLCSLQYSIHELAWTVRLYRDPENRILGPRHGNFTFTFERKRCVSSGSLGLCHGARACRVGRTSRGGGGLLASTSTMASPSSPRISSGVRPTPVIQIHVQQLYFWLYKLSGNPVTFTVLPWR